MDYLRAIQQVPGKTPGEKFKSLNQTARTIANAFRSQQDFSTAKIHPTSTLPEEFIPLVRLEVAKILRQPEEIVEALKSDDHLVFSRALACKWFFNGSLLDYTNPRYFVSQIFPNLSLRNRARVIRTLSKNLNPLDPTVAEDFYEALSEKYGNNQSQPLLLNCRNTFISTKIQTHQLTLTNWTFKRLFRKHPELIANYLICLTIDALDRHQELTKDLVKKLEQFLPQILKYFPNDFIKILLTFHQEHFNLKLNSNRLTRQFCQQSETFQALLAHPQIFFPMLSIKVMTQKLTKDHFKSCLVKSFRNYRGEPCQFSCERILSKDLKYFPKDDAILLFLSAFEERYGVSYLECHDIISPLIVRRLPEKMRVDFMKTQEESGIIFYKSDSVDSWTCYLPTEKAIKAIKNQIKVTSDGRLRCRLLASLVETCLINNNHDALLEVLNYIATRHKNEQGHYMSVFFAELNRLFHVDNLTPAIWNCLMNLLTRLYYIDKAVLKDFWGIHRFVMEKIFFNLINHLPVEKDVEFLIEIGVEESYLRPISDDKPLHLQKQCLEIIINAIPSMRDRLKNKISNWLNLIYNILISIYAFNKLNTDLKTSRKKKLKLLSPKNYPWLCEEIPTIFTNPSLPQIWVDYIESLLIKEDPELFQLWIEDESKIFNVYPVYTMNILKRNHQKILKKWQVYYEECKNHIRSGYTQYFIKSCRWYEDLPVKFVEKALQDLSTSEDGRELIILALLVEGKKFEQIIERFIPISMTVNMDDKNSRINLAISKSIMIAANVQNDLLSSEIYFKYFDGDYLVIAQYHLKNRSKREKIDDICQLAKKFMENPEISIKKHGIRVFFAVSTHDQQMKMMATLMDTEEHQNIWYILFKIMRNKFVSQPRFDNFALMCECLEKISLDDRDMMKKIMNFDKIHDQYLVDYFKILLATIDNPKKFKDPNDRVDYISSMMNYANTHQIGSFFSESYHRELLEKYFGTLMSRDIVSSLCKYLVDNYIGLAGEKLEFRLNFFSKLLKKILTQYWNTSKPDSIRNYPANSMLQMLTDYILISSIEKNIKGKLLDRISDSLCNIIVNPAQQVPKYYMMIKLYSLDFDDTTTDTAAKIASVLPNFVDVFSIGLIETIAEIILNTLEILYKHRNDFRSFFSEIVKCLLTYDQELITHLCAIWLTKSSYADSCHEMYTKKTQILDRSTDCAVIATLCMHKGKLD